MRRDDDMAFVPGTILHQTPRAWLLRLADKQEIWIPKSQGALLEECSTPGLFVRKWLIEKKELYAIQAPDDDLPDPHEILGVDFNANPAVVKARHKELVRLNHPDRMSGLGVDPEIVRFATERMATINQAFDRLKEGAPNIAQR